MTAKRLPGRFRRFERESQGEVLAVAALIVELAGDRGVERKAQTGDNHCHRTENQSEPPTSSKPRKQHDRRNQDRQHPHRRAEQSRAALWSEIGDGLLENFRGAPAVACRLAGVEEQVMAGTRTPAAAARALLAALLDKRHEE